MTFRVRSAIQGHFFQQQAFTVNKNLPLPGTETAKLGVDGHSNNIRA